MNFAYIFSKEEGLFWLQVNMNFIIII